MLAISHEADMPCSAPVYSATALYAFVAYLATRVLPMCDEGLRETWLSQDRTWR